MDTTEAKVSIAVDASSPSHDAESSTSTLQFVDSAGAIMRGNRLYHEANYNAALDYYTKAFEKEHSILDGPNTTIMWNIHNRLAAVHTKLKDYDSVHKEADEMIRLDPTNPKGFVRKGGAFFFQHKGAEALDSYSKAKALMELDSSQYETQLTRLHSYINTVGSSSNTAQ
eukprot:TRINITY_DN2771_c0_g1_i2.p1 TRINITY_DN2771_c0_g1~~TRINITY_DN2771_c0_g1_i2.p1  ORF type:complete len:170 (-),score=34.16 TRINITY_DN2771_c0_g1_i2:41-550(-)